MKNLLADSRSAPETAFQSAHRDYVRADRAVMIALRALLPKGTPVQWRHGRQVRRGVVAGVPNWNRYWGARVFVRSATSGREFSVSAHALTEGLRS